MENLFDQVKDIKLNIIRKFQNGIKENSILNIYQLNGYLIKHSHNIKEIIIIHDD